jgi:hydrogenase maturation factor
MGVSVDKSDPRRGVDRALAVRGRDTTGEASGMPMRVLALDPAGSTRARCAGIDGIAVTVETALISPIEPGAIVLVQAGIALARLDAEWVL